MRRALEATFCERMSNSAVKAPVSAVLVLFPLAALLMTPHSSRFFTWWCCSSVHFFFFFNDDFVVTINSNNFSPCCENLKSRPFLNLHVLYLEPRYNVLFPLFSGSRCPPSRGTASTPSLHRRWTETPAWSWRAMWWPLRAKWGHCAGTTCWCTGSMSRTDTCEANTHWGADRKHAKQDHGLDCTTRYLK